MSTTEPTDKLKMSDLGLVLGAIKGCEMELQEAAFKVADGEFKTGRACLEMALEWLEQAALCAARMK